MMVENYLITPQLLIILLIFYHKHFLITQHIFNALLFFLNIHQINFDDARSNAISASMKILL